MNRTGALTDRCCRFAVEGAFDSDVPPVPQDHSSRLKNLSVASVPTVLLAEAYPVTRWDLWTLPVLAHESCLD